MSLDNLVHIAVQLVGSTNKSSKSEGTKMNGHGDANIEPRTYNSQLNPSEQTRLKWKRLARTKNSSVQIEEIPTIDDYTSLKVRLSTQNINEKCTKDDEILGNEAKKACVEANTTEMVEVASHKWSQNAP